MFQLISTISHVSFFFVFDYLVEEVHYSLVEKFESEH